MSEVGTNKSTNESLLSQCLSSFNLSYSLEASILSPCLLIIVNVSRNQGVYRLLRILRRTGLVELGERITCFLTYTCGGPGVQGAGMLCTHARSPFPRCRGSKMADLRPPSRYWISNFIAVHSLLYLSCDAHGCSIIHSRMFSLIISCDVIYLLLNILISGSWCSLWNYYHPQQAVENNEREKK